MINEALVDQACSALVDVLSKAELPVGVRRSDGKMLLIEKYKDDGLIALCIDTQTGSRACTLANKLPCEQLLVLIKEGLRGPELAACLSPAAKDTAQAAYRDLVQAIGKAGLMGSYALYEEYLKKSDSEDGLLGKIYTEPFADGSAIYMVTQISGSNVRLQHLAIGDAWSVPHLGADGWAPLQLVQSDIDRRKTWNALVQGQPNKKKGGPTLR